MQRRIFLVLLINGLIGFVTLSGQSVSLHRHRLLIAKDTVHLDTLSIVPGSLYITNLAGDTIVSDSYEIDFINASLMFRTQYFGDSLWADFRLFSVRLGSPYFHRDIRLITQTPDIIGNPYIYNPAEHTEDLFDFGDMNYNGSFARGLSMGNAQDVVLNSSFNLELSGNLGNGVTVAAAMTDQNLPLQPDGNTQQLQDFDKVFIKLQKDQTQLIAGDFELKNPPGYFMRLTRKLQGLGFSTSFDMPASTNNRLALNAAVSKGNYARNSFMGQEGIQGPYSLKGNHGETFIIVLAGTEKVYLDGELLARGADFDYVIDYNSGELTFTPNRMISKDKRIEVEFQYSVQNYFRSIIYAQDEWASDKLQLHLALYSEQDSKNQPLLQVLDSTSQRALFKAGDDQNKAVLPGFDSTGFDPLVKMYRLVDTSIGLQTFDSVLVYSNDPAKAFFRASFAFVGTGKGNYHIKSTDINGRIYEWVAPVAGMPQGDYESVSVLIAPEKKQMLTFGALWKTGKTGSLTGELALSNRDFNTFSPKDDADNAGLAFTLGTDQKINIRSDSIKPLYLGIFASWEYDQKAFKALDNYRDIEFQRNWNLPASDTAATEQWLRAGIGLSGKPENHLDYAINNFNRVGIYQGWKHELLGNYRQGGFNARSNSWLLKSTGIASSGQYLRPDISLSNTFTRLGNLSTTLHFRMEDNRQYAKSDTLIKASYRNKVLEARITSADTGKGTLAAAYTWRNDEAPLATDFQALSTAHDMNLSGRWLPAPGKLLSWTMTYRKLFTLDSLKQKQASDVYLGRLQYNFSLWKGLIRWNLVYEIGSGQEQKREFTYLKVPTGQGNFIWNDNGDGVEQLDEFEPASINDVVLANYIRILTPTNEFINTNSTSLNQVFKLNPAAIWRRQKGVKGFLSRFSDDVVYQANKKVLASLGSSSLNPFDLNVADSGLISVNASFRNVFYFNRSNPSFNAELMQSELRNKILLTNGPESKTLSARTLKLRWNISHSWTLEENLNLARNANHSELLSKRNYDYTTRESTSTLSFLSGAVFRVKGMYRFAQKTNDPAFGVENALIHQLNTEIRYNVIGNSSLSARYSFAAIQYNGDSSGTLAYNMLEGLQPGSNHLWNITFEKKLANNLQISISYDGRKTGTNKMIHIGSAQFRAIF